MDDIILQSLNKVSDILGNYYRENVYQNALILELRKNGLTCQTEVVINILYNNVYVGFERADIVIYDGENKICRILELKSQTSKISSKEINQLRNYLNNTSCPKGYVVNFYEKLNINSVEA